MAVSTQGSRGGLIATIVIFVVLWLVMTIMWIYSNTQLTKQTQALESLTKKYQEVASSSALSSEGDVQQLLNAKDKIAGDLQGGQTAVDIALAEIRRLTRRINNTPSSNFADADQAATDAIARAEKALGTAGATSQPAAAGRGANAAAGTSLVAELDKLSAALSQQILTNKDQGKQLAAVKADLDKRAGAWDAQFAELNNKLADAEKRATDATNQTMEAQKKYEAAIGSASTDAQKTAAEAGNQVQQLQQDLAKANATIAADNKKVNDLSNKLSSVRGDVKNSVVRQPDGNIIRIPSQQTVYINLGQGDHVPVGMTFEVYDKNEGVPPLTTEPTGNSNLPTGKASIEVVRVGQNSSECRVVHLTPGATLSEGDIIANLVYDKNTTYNFVVFGVFDVDGNNVYTAQEADVIKSLVTRWGGKVQDKINANTDFVVLGKEPEVPALTKEEMEDPVLKSKYDKAVADLKAYQDVMNQASELHIPIMNQNRFMYYVGYFDQLKR
jgi:hypothetical protein